MNSCEAAARLVDLEERDVTTCGRAALLQDRGRVSLPNSIRDKAGRMTAAEWERVRLHPYFTERILNPSGYWRRLGISFATEG